MRAGKSATVKIKRNGPDMLATEFHVWAGLCGDCYALHHLFRGDRTIAGGRKSDCSVGSGCVLVVIS